MLESFLVLCVRNVMSVDGDGVHRAIRTGGPNSKGPQGRCPHAQVDSKFHY
jgi:hypothetical protein